MSKKNQRYMHRATALFSKIIRTRDGSCRVCGSTWRLEAAHIMPRGWRSVRCDLDNAVALCSEHHQHFEEHKAEWQDWIEENYPGRWDDLRERALSYERVDWKSKLEELRELAAEMEAA